MIQTDDYFDPISGNVYCLMGDDTSLTLYLLDEEEDEWNEVEDPDEDEEEIQNSLASLPIPSPRLFQRIDVVPHLTWEGTSVPIPVPVADEDRPFVIPQDTTLGYLFQPLHQKNLVEEGVDVESPYGEQLEEYYELMVSELEDQYELWNNDKEEFQDTYGDYEGGDWEQVMNLYSKVDTDELGLHYSSSVVNEEFIVKLSIGDQEVSQ